MLHVACFNPDYNPQKNSVRAPLWRINGVIARQHEQTDI